MSYRQYPNADRALRQVQRHPRPVPTTTIAPFLTGLGPLQPSSELEAWREQFQARMAEFGQSLRAAVVVDMTRAGEMLSQAMPVLRPGIQASLPRFTPEGEAPRR